MFRILEDYDITYGPNDYGYKSEYVNQCTTDTESKKAHIYPWEGPREEFGKYRLHEHLHIAFAELMSDYSKEREELLVQDITEKILEGRNALYNLIERCEEMSDSELREKTQDEFGFVLGETYCAQCGCMLTRENCTWSFGRWWHTKVSDCKEHEKLTGA